MLLRAGRRLLETVVIRGGRMRPGFLLFVDDKKKKKKKHAHIIAATLDGGLGNGTCDEAIADAQEDCCIIVTSKSHTSRTQPPAATPTAAAAAAAAVQTSDSERIDHVEAEEEGGVVSGTSCLNKKEQKSCESGGRVEEEEEEEEEDQNPATAATAAAADFPIPLSPFGGESAKQIEYARALLAEAAMKAGEAAIGRQDVLFEDEWLLVVNKPRGLYSEHVFASVLSSLMIIPSDTTDSHQHHLHLANRLDRDTSGVMVITKCKQAAAKLTQAFTERKVHKSYLAMCAAPRPSWNRVRIESGHGRSRFGAWRVYAKSDVGRILPGGSTVRDMVTQLELIELSSQPHESHKPRSQALTLTTPADSATVIVAATSGADALVRSEKNRSHQEKHEEEEETVTVLRAFPETGRTHQIRLHCQYLGLPLCGDVKYGGPQTWKGMDYDSHALHAESIAFTHPVTFDTLRICAPCPRWAADLGVCTSVLSPTFSSREAQRMLRDQSYAKN